MQELLDPRINGWLAQFFVWAMGGGVLCFVAFCKIMWDVIKTQRDLNGKVTTLMETLGKDIESVKSDIKRLEGQMVGWDVLKRIELLLSAMPNSERESNLAKALKVEIDSREPRGQK